MDPGTIDLVDRVCANSQPIVVTPESTQVASGSLGDAFPFSLLTWNICYDPRAVDSYEYCAWKSRGPNVISFLRHVITKEIANDPSRCVIIALQEVSEDSMEDLVNLFVEFGFEHFLHPCTPIRYILTAFSPVVVKGKITSLSICNLNFEKPMILDARICYQSFLVTSPARKYAPGQFIITNCHIPMDIKFRLEISVHVARQIHLEAQCHRAPAIICGDFNTFPDDNGLLQANMIQSIGFYDSTAVTTTTYVSCDKSIVIATQDRALETFAPYPYDIPKILAPAPVYQLDHIFVRCLSDVGNAYSTKMFHGTAVAYDLRTGQTMVRTDITGITIDSMRPSDHMPILQRFIVGTPSARINELPGLLAPYNLTITD